jgi:hypothetical protein
MRTFAAAAANDGQPPIAVFGVDGTYATALVCLLSYYTTIGRISINVWYSIGAPQLPHWGNVGERNRP